MLYDCFTFFDELDILDVRFQEMWDCVDRFVIVEADRTFQGAPKPLHFLENRRRFENRLKKIIHVPVSFPDDPQKLYPRAVHGAWAREFFQRDQIARGLEDARPDDLVIVSDVDEIIGKQALAATLDSFDPRFVTIFTMPQYEGAMNRKRVDFEWTKGPRLLEFRCFTSAQKVRNLNIVGSRTAARLGLERAHTRLKNFWRCGIGKEIRLIRNAGWHFSSIGTWSDFVTKMDAYSHVERKAEAGYRDERLYWQDLLKRTTAVPISELPQYVQDNSARFGLISDEQAAETRVSEDPILAPSP